MNIAIPQCTINCLSRNNMTEPDTFANSRIYMGSRLMLLCHRHALALIDLADGNGVRLRIEPLEIEDFGEQCRACMAADPDPGFL
jgi:hypothetical protein